MITKAFQIKGKGKQVPPALRHVIIYFLQKGKSETEARLFFDYYDAQQWLNTRNEPLSNWKSSAWEWIWNRS